MRDAPRSFLPRASGWCALAAIAALCGAAAASAETVRWRHDDPDRVAGFRIFYGPEPRSYDSVVDVRLPVPVDGVYEYELAVPSGEPVYLAVTAYAEGGVESTFSNEGVVRPDPLPWQAPPGGALWSSGFDALYAGNEAPGWFDTQAGNSMSEDRSLFYTTALDGDRALTTESTETNIHSHFLDFETGDGAAYEFRGRMQVEHPEGGIGVTVQSQYPERDMYYRLKRQFGKGTGMLGDFYVQPHPWGYPLDCDSETTGVVPLPKLWYRFRFQVLPERDDTRVLAKVWREDEPEPAGWQIDCRDREPDRPASGKIGVWSMGPGRKYWDDLAVIDLREDEPAPPPAPEPEPQPEPEPEPKPTLGPPGVPVLLDP